MGLSPHLRTDATIFSRSAPWLAMIKARSIFTIFFPLSFSSGCSLPIRSRSFQGRAIGDRHRRSLDRDQMPNFEFAQRARHGFASDADEFRNFFVGQRHLDSRALFCLLRSGGPRQQQSGEFFLRGSGQTHSVAVVRRLPGTACVICRATPCEASGCFATKRWKSSRRTKATWHGRIVSAVTS